MVNYYDKHLFISKKKLAELADVSPRTFSRYLASRRHILEAMGISPKAQKLPPQAVKYICEDYSKTRRPSANPPSATSSSNPGKTNNSTSKPATTYYNISHQNHESAKT